MQKFRASMEPFWDLKFGEYVEYLTRVFSDSELLTSIECVAFSDE